MNKLTENIRARVTKAEKEKLMKEVLKRDTNISEFIRNLIIEYFYEPSEEEIEQNVFIEKVKALKILTGASLDTCRKTLIDVNGDTTKAMYQLRSFRKVNRLSQDKPPTNPYKVRFIFDDNGIEELSSYRNEINITDDDLRNTRMCTLSMVDVDLKPESNCGINYIDIVCPIKATRRAIYDNILAYLENIAALDKNKSYDVKPEKMYFSPTICIQSLEDALYAIIEFYEKNQTVRSELIKEYMKKVNDIHIKYYGHRQ